MEKRNSNILKDGVKTNGKPILEQLNSKKRLLEIQIGQNKKGAAWRGGSKWKKRSSDPEWWD